MKELIVEEIQKCNLCADIDGILLNKPKVFRGSLSPKVMIIGHSPAVRVSEKAEVVLKMDNPKRALYRYIKDNILYPLDIQIEDLYCTNLIKCNTSLLPEDINKKDRDYIKRVSNNCIKLLEKEIEDVNPNLIISLSGRVFEILSERYLGRKMKIRDNFGEHFVLKISDRDYNYTPIIHIPKSNRVKDYYFPKQTERLKRLKIYLHNEEL